MLTKWIQANPKCLVYKVFVVGGGRRVDAGSHLRTSSDSAFKKVEQTGQGMRGTAYLLCPCSTEVAFVHALPCHLLDPVSRQQRKVVRATFIAELLGACDSTDKIICLTQLLREVSSGNCSIEGALQRCEQGEYSVPLIRNIDAMSAFVAVTALFINIPVDNVMLSHVQYLME